MLLSGATGQTSNKATQFSKMILSESLSQDILSFLKQFPNNLVHVFFF